MANKRTKISVKDGDVIDFNGYDSAVIDIKDVGKPTPDGFLTATPRVARTGIQIYRGSELGLSDMKEVRVYRPESEVFGKDAMASLAHRTITNGHPPNGVSEKNWKQHSVGWSGGDVARDGDFIRVPMIVADGDMIKEAKEGKSQFSVGYSAKLKWGDGVTKGGEQYDATQTDIRANHIAFVKTARGGPQLRLGDKSPKERKDEDMKTIIVDGIGIELGGKDASIVERRIKTLEDALGTSIQQLKDGAAAATTLQGTIQTKDAEIVTLKKQLADATLTPQALDQLVKERQLVIDAAKKMMGDSLVVDGRTNMDIRKQVVTAKLGAAQVAGWSDESVASSFATLAVQAITSNANGGGSTISDAAAALSRPGFRGDSAEKAYNDSIADLTNAWKGPQHKVAVSATT